MKDLSIIIPFAGEYPQAIFTVQSIAQSLLGKLDFEIIVVNNYCKELETQWRVASLRALEQAQRYIDKSIDKSGEVDPLDVFNDIRLPNMSNQSAEAFKASEKGNVWLKYMEFDGRLSHWECKRLAVEQAQSDTFLFVDAHTIPSMGIENMFYEYVDEGYSDEGTFHMPLTYKILEWHKLIYKMVVKDNFYSYSFTSFRESNRLYEVPVMSCCGVMISRKVLDTIGGWPHHMQAYGGGENFLNYSLAVTGMKKFIYPNVTLYHHGEKRDYHSTYDGTLKNRMIAHYLFGGKECLIDFAHASKGKEEVLKKMAIDIINNPDHSTQRILIKANTKINLSDFVDSWKE